MSISMIHEHTVCESQELHLQTSAPFGISSAAGMNAIRLTTQLISIS